MSTEATTTTTSRLPSISTATSRSQGSTAARVQLRKRPAAPSLFPPLPPATLAVQREQLTQKVTSPVDKTEGRSSEERARWGSRFGLKPNHNWL
jgi:hypothetical protein